MTKNKVEEVQDSDGENSAKNKSHSINFNKLERVYFSNAEQEHLLSQPMPGEEQRLKFLKEMEIFDSEPEEGFDRITSLASRYFKFPISVISFMDKDRHFFKSRLGIPVSSAPRHLSFCTFTYIDENAEIFVVEDTHTVPSLRDSYMVQNPPYIRFYAGASIFIDNVKVGSLCVIDHIARKFDENQQYLLLQMAECVGELLKFRHQQQQRAVQTQIVMAHQNALLELQNPLELATIVSRRLKRTVQKLFPNSECVQETHLYRQEAQTHALIPVETPDILGVEKASTPCEQEKKLGEEGHQTISTLLLCSSLSSSDSSDDEEETQNELIVTDIIDAVVEGKEDSTCSSTMNKKEASTIPIENKAAPLLVSPKDHSKVSAHKSHKRQRLPLPHKPSYYTRENKHHLHKQRLQAKSSFSLSTSLASMPATASTHVTTPSCSFILLPPQSAEVFTASYRSLHNTSHHEIQPESNANDSPMNMNANSSDNSLHKTNPLDSGTKPAARRHSGTIHTPVRWSAMQTKEFLQLEEVVRDLAEHVYKLHLATDHAMQQLRIALIDTVENTRVSSSSEVTADAATLEKPLSAKYKNATEGMQFMRFNPSFVSLEALNTAPLDTITTTTVVSMEDHVDEEGSSEGLLIMDDTECVSAKFRQSSETVVLSTTSPSTSKKLSTPPVDVKLTSTRTKSLLMSDFLKRQDDRASPCKEFESMHDERVGKGSRQTSLLSVDVEDDTEIYLDASVDQEDTDEVPPLETIASRIKNVFNINLHDLSPVPFPSPLARAFQHTFFPPEPSSATAAVVINTSSDTDTLSTYSEQPSANAASTCIHKHFFPAEEVITNPNSIAANIQEEKKPIARSFDLAFSPASVASMVVPALFGVRKESTG